MDIYIRGVGLVSPQPTFRKDYFLEEVEEYIDNRIYCIEPDFSDYLDPASSRRLSRIIKLGVVAARTCLTDSGIEMPDGIITGTGFGMVEDTERFLLAMLENGEKFLPPTPFIQSTHNTLGAYVSQMLKCHSYNFTYAHRGSSFESALLDGSLLIQEGNALNVMVGAFEENTENQVRIFDRIGYWKKEKISNLKLFQSTSNGSIAGEGVGFYMLTGRKESSCYAQLRGVETVYKPGNRTDMDRGIGLFLERNNMDFNDIDIVLLGVSGCCSHDRIYHELRKKLFPGKIHAGYKHLSGESHSSVFFALWLAAGIVKRQLIPPVILLEPGHTKTINNILIYNHWQETNHSLLLISKC